MFCHECGSKLKEGAQFCVQCGTKAKKRDNRRIEPQENELQKLVEPTPVTVPQQSSSMAPQPEAPERRMPDKGYPVAFEAAPVKGSALKYIVPACVFIVIVGVIACLVMFTDAFKPKQDTAQNNEIIETGVRDKKNETEDVNKSEEETETVNKSEEETETENVINSEEETDTESDISEGGNDTNSETTLETNIYLPDDVPENNDGYENAGNVEYPFEAMYFNIPISWFIDEPMHYLAEIFGEPDEDNRGNGYLTFYYDMFTVEHDMGLPYTVYGIHGLNPRDVSINGITLDKVRNELNAAFGESGYEYFDEGYGDTFTAGYNVVYNVYTEYCNYTVIISAQEYDGKPYAVSITGLWDW